MATTDTRPAFDLLDPEFYRSAPWEAFRWMRANEPVYRDEGNGLWGITRHADVLDVERRSDVFSSQACYRAVPSPGEVNMIAQDDPQHQKQRRLVANRFTPRAVRSNDEHVREVIDELVEAAAARGEMEVVDDLAAQLPARLTCRLLGFPEDRWRDLKSWSERLMRTDMRERDPEQANEFYAANFEFVAVLQELLPERMGCPADDLLSVWTQAEIDGQKLSPEQIVHETGLFIAGGAETTRTVIAHGLRAFADHPDQWELLHDHPEHVPTAVEEMIRWVTPLNNFFRDATEDTEVAGQPIAAGDRVILLYPSANRDEAVFDEPDRFDVTRDPNPHVAFGHGTHFCLGANFARHELRLLLEALTRRITDLRPLAEPDVEPNIFARAVRSFPLAFRAR